MIKDIFLKLISEKYDVKKLSDLLPGFLIINNHTYFVGDSGITSIILGKHIEFADPNAIESIFDMIES